MSAEVYAPLVALQDERQGGWRIVVAKFARPPKGQGNPVLVEFDWRAVYRLEDRTRAVAGFFHTHPDGLSEMSGTDERTMRGWTAALGKPLLCVIRSGEAVAAWEFHPGGKFLRARAAAVCRGLVIVVVRHVRP
jgi:hypothetical protein